MAASSPNSLSSTRQIAHAAGLVMGLFVLSRITGLGREVLIGARFGTGAELDAYLAAFRLPETLFHLTAGGALGSAFLPIFSRALAQGDCTRTWRLASSVFNLLVLALTLAAMLAAWAAPWLVAHVIAPGFPLEQQVLTVELMRWMLISTVIFGGSGLIMAILNAHQHFLFPALAPSLYNLGIIAGAWLLTPHWGVYGLVVGVVAGASAHLLVQVPALLRRGVRYHPILTLRDRDVRQVMVLMGPRVVGLAAFQINFLVNTILASGLAAGSLSALNYAWILMLLPQGMVGQALGTAAFPTFSAQVARGEFSQMRATFTTTLQAVLFLSIPASAGLWMLGEPLVATLLERGAFDASSTQAVAFALSLFAVGLTGHTVVEIGSRAFYALQDTRTPVMVAVATVILNILLSLWWVRWLSYGGLALANSAATLLEMMVLIWLLHRRLRGLDVRRVLLTTARIGLATGVMVGVLWLLLRALDGQPSVLTAAAGLGLGAGVYVVASVALGAEEPRALWRILRRR